MQVPIPAGQVHGITIENLNSNNNFIVAESDVKGLPLVYNNRFTSMGSIPASGEYNITNSNLNSNNNYVSTSANKIFPITSYVNLNYETYPNAFRSGGYIYEIPEDVRVNKATGPENILNAKELQRGSNISDLNIFSSTVSFADI